MAKEIIVWVILALTLLLTACDAEYECQMTQNISYNEIGNELNTRELIHQNESDFNIKIVSQSTPGQRVTQFYSDKNITATTTEFFFNDKTIYVYAYPNGTYKTNANKESNYIMTFNWTCPVKLEPPVGCACPCQ